MTISSDAPMSAVLNHQKLRQPTCKDMDPEMIGPTIRLPMYATQ